MTNVQPIAGRKSSGQAITAPMTGDGYLQVALGDRIAGENVAQDYLRAVPVGSYYRVATGGSDTSFTIKNTPGAVLRIHLWASGASGSITIMDGGNTVTTIITPSSLSATQVYDIGSIHGSSIVVTRSSTTIGFTVIYV